MTDTAEESDCVGHCSEDVDETCTYLMSQGAEFLLLISSLQMSQHACFFLNWIENYGTFGFEFVNMVTFQLFEIWDGYNERSPALARHLRKGEQIVGRLNGRDYMNREGNLQST